MSKCDRNLSSCVLVASYLQHLVPSSKICKLALYFAMEGLKNVISETGSLDSVKHVIQVHYLRYRWFTTE